MDSKEVALTIGILIIILLGTQLYSMNTKITELNNQQQILSNQLNSANSQITKQAQTIGSLEKSYNEALENIKTKKENIENIENELDTTKESLEQTETKITDIKTELDSFETQVYESLNWFKQNTDIKELSEYEDIRKYIRSRCIQEYENSCNLKLACLSHINNKIHGFKYKIDEETSSSKDKLQNLTQFAISKGGDCEDYSLLVAAEINYAKDYCISEGLDEFSVESVKHTGDNDIWYAIDNFNKWGYTGSVSYDISTDYRFHYIVCGNYPTEADPNLDTKGEVSGHCAIAFVKQKLTTTQNISNIFSDMIIFEPQSGFLTFNNKIKPISMHIPADGLKEMPFRYYIWAIIAPDDYYIYKQYNNPYLEWKGYNDFIPEIEYLKKQI